MARNLYKNSKNLWKKMLLTHKENKQIDQSLERKIHKDEEQNIKKREECQQTENKRGEKNGGNVCLVL